MLIEVIGFLVAVCLSMNNAALPKKCSRDRARDGNIVIDGILCEKAKLGKIPQGLPSDINCLDIRSDTIVSLAVADFQTYSKLKYLKLSYLGILHVEKDTFVDLENLVYVDLSGNHIDSLPALPTSLETLLVDQMAKSLFFSSDQTVANMKTLKSLKKLSMQNNRLVSLPKFVLELKSLNELEINDNAVDRLTPEDVASVCNLKDLKFDGNAIAQTHNAVCECVGLQKWASKNGIRVHNLTCPQVSGVDKKACERDAESRAASVRYECTIWSSWPYLGGGLSVVMILISCCCWFYFKRRKSNVAKNVANHFPMFDQKKAETTKLDGIPV